MPNSAIRIMHFADVHFGVESYGRHDPATGLSTRLLDFRSALNAAIDIAIQADVELAVFAGDAYKTRDPNQTHQREFAGCLGRLTERGIPVLLLAGNHDVPNTRGRANSIEIFAALAGEKITVLDKPGVSQVITAKGNAVQVAAVPYLTKSMLLTREEHAGKGVQETTQAIVDRYVHTIDVLAGECAEHTELPTIFAGHFTVTSAKIGANQSIYLANEPEVPKSALIRSEFDYVALGHIHKFQDLNKSHQPPVIYCGSIERIDFGERSEAKGFVLADIARGAAEYKFVEVSTRPFVEIDVDTTRGSDDPTEKILKAIAKEDLKNAVVKLSYKIKSEDLPLVRDKDIRAALNDAFMVVAVHKDIVRDGESVRSKALTESLDPMQALASYLETRETLKSRKDELLTYAKPLWDELESEERLR
ncbi:MAG TPA: exonuclease SbcCD subunit D [Capsulimonadaceae bacterium]|nr:exonuclease SbcCD subunit D [Capsulimonadaceae bacterium]